MPASSTVDNKPCLLNVVFFSDALRAGLARNLGLSAEDAGNKIGFRFKGGIEVKVDPIPHWPLRFQIIKKASGDFWEVEVTYNNVECWEVCLQIKAGPTFSDMKPVELPFVGKWLDLTHDLRPAWRPDVLPEIHSWVFKALGLNIEGYYAPEEPEVE